MASIHSTVQDHGLSEHRISSSMVHRKVWGYLRCLAILLLLDIQLHHLQGGLLGIAARFLGEWPCLQAASIQSTSGLCSLILGILLPLPLQFPRILRAMNSDSPPISAVHRPTVDQKCQLICAFYYN